jgi:hypothetical protein
MFILDKITMIDRLSIVRSSTAARDRAEAMRSEAGWVLAQEKGDALQGRAERRGR